LDLVVSGLGEAEVAEMGEKTERLKEKQAKLRA
jgi:hypothetical protein